MNILTWMRQPTSVAGLAAFIAALVALMSGQIDWRQAVPLLAGALTSIAVPDNTAGRPPATTVFKNVTTQTSDKLPGVK